VLRSFATNVAAITISFIVLFYINKQDQAIFFKNKLVIFIICFFLFILMNSLIQHQSFDLILKSIGNFRYLLLSAGVYFTLERATQKQKVYFIYLNLFLISFICGDIIYQYFFNKDIFGLKPGMCDEELKNCVRFSGVFGDELIAGGYLSQIGLLIFFLFKNLNFNKSYLNFWTQCFFFLLLFVVIILTGERNAFIIFMLSVFFIGFFRKKFFNLFLIFLLLISIIIAASYKFDSINSRFLNFSGGWSSDKKLSIVQKIKESPWSLHYQSAFELFLNKPMIGHGFKSFRVKCSETIVEKKIMAENFKLRNYRGCSSHPHSYLLEFLSEQGILGGLFYIGLIFIVLFNVYRVSRYEKKNEVFITVALGSLILAITFPLKPSGSFFTTFNASVLFYIFGFFLNYLKRVK